MYNYEKRKLSFQIVPETAWYENLRSVLPNWAEISSNVRSIGHCEICGAITDELDAHEVWFYNDKDHEQKLVDIIAVCKDCHHAIHIGYASVNGTWKEALRHYTKINNCSPLESIAEMEEARAVWEKRSQVQWKLNEDELKEKVKELTGIDCNIDEAIDGKYYAMVSYDQKDIAKSMGAKWDWKRKMWYFNSKEEKEAYIAFSKR